MGERGEDEHLLIPRHPVTADSELFLLDSFGVTEHVDPDTDVTGGHLATCSQAERHDGDGDGGDEMGVTAMFLVGFFHLFLDPLGDTHGEQHEPGPEDQRGDAEGNTDGALRGDEGRADEAHEDDRGNECPDNFEECFLHSDYCIWVCERQNTPYTLQTIQEETSTNKLICQYTI